MVQTNSSSHLLNQPNSPAGAHKAGRYAAREKLWRSANSDRQAIYSQRWKDKNPERARQLRNARARKSAAKKREDPAWVLRRRVSARMLRSLKSIGGKRRRGWEELVGYSLDDLRAHIGGLFQAGMNWENMGLWHIDHIRPVSSFEITSVDDAAFRECWALKNLRPLWASENLKKSNKWPSQPAPSAPPAPSQG
jgi:hypothetical protein